MKTLLIALMFNILGVTSFTQGNLSGIWKTENDNTLIKIEEQGGTYIGKVLSSDNKNARLGTQIIKDVILADGKWKCQLYAPKREKWYNAELSVNGNKLDIVVSVGFISKSLEWLKVKS